MPVVEVASQSSLVYRVCCLAGTDLLLFYHPICFLQGAVHKLPHPTLLMPSVRSYVLANSALEVDLARSEVSEYSEANQPAIPASRVWL